MLHRRDGESLVIITQPAHAWVSGQLADAWNSERLGIDCVQPELRLAAAQHDIGWLDWEAAPTLNPDTGLPYAFSQLPTLEHLDVWSTSTPRALSYGYLPATLISMHGTYLYRRFHNFDNDSDEEVRAARAFLQREEKFQHAALERISEVHGLNAERVERMRLLLSAWDAMSLAICIGATERRVISDIPTGDGRVDLSLTPLDASRFNFAVSPWPFGASKLTLVCEGREIAGTFTDVETMRTTLRSARRMRLEFELVEG